MENYIGIVIAVEDYHLSQKLKKVDYALNDANTFIESLVKLGCNRDKIKFLSNNLATKTTISEALKETVNYATETETIVFYYAGHGFFYNGKNLISCVDTSLTSLESTTIALNTILSLLDNSRSNKVIAFLDCCHSGIEFTRDERSPVTDFSTDDLKYEYRDAEHLAVFASCKSDEKSHTDIERRHGVWSYFLIQALSGKAKGIYEDNLLFSDKLQKYLQDSTSRRVKQITTDKKNQTPIKYGKETKEKFIVADLSKVFSENEFITHVEGIRFERAIILSSEDDWVRNLPGFLPRHKPPKEIDSYHESWIQNIATQLIKEELNTIAKALAEKLHYKRRDIEEPIIEDGVGQLSTLEFDYYIQITQSRERPDKYVLTRSLENFKNSNILSSPIFNEVFEDMFDELEFRSTSKVDVESIIDKIEEIDNDLVSVEYERTDTSKCIVYIKGLSGFVSISKNSFKITLERKDSPQNMVIACQKIYKEIGQQGIPKFLE